MFYTLWAYAKYDGKIFDHDKGIPDYNHHDQFNFERNKISINFKDGHFPFH